MDIFVTIVIIGLSVILHEVAHGYAANWLGDPTARLNGRLTLNPLSHIDPLGSLIIPAVLVILKAPFFIGYAKPVPYNPYNLRNQRWGEAFVALAGPATNMLLAIIFGIIVRVAIHAQLSSAFINVASSIVILNLVLTFFNLIPLPPADGSKVIAPFLPYRIQQQYTEFGARVGMGGILFLFLFLSLFGNQFYNFVLLIFSLLTGI